MLTRRGYVLIGVVVVAELMAILFGARALNAIVAPGVIALGAGALQMRGLEEPEFEREGPESGFEGDTEEIHLVFDTDKPFTARVVDTVPDGLEVRDGGNEVETSIDDTQIVYEVDLTKRGEYRLGPVRMVAQDVFGLFEKEIKFTKPHMFLVFPRIYEVDLINRAEPSPSGDGFFFEYDELTDGVVGQQRQGFDQLREYEPGDTLRDIHWKITAKEPDEDIIVKEFVGINEKQDIMIAAASDGSSVDETARATASVIFHLMEAGFDVGLTLANGSVEPDQGDDQLYAMLSLLARTTKGTPSNYESADLLIEGTEEHDEVQVIVNDRNYDFSDLSGVKLELEKEGQKQVVRADGGTDKRTKRGMNHEY
ncbi:MAG: DUF58 domain-containing protein [Halobacteria archaeon]|nr:DUF58 domain-containing protein [Halobacteria archaeon]